MKVTFQNILESKYAREVREWRNQDFVRLNMTNQDIISEEQHIAYLDMLRNNKETRQSYIALENNETPFGILNFTIDYEGQYVEPGTYIINQMMLGKGYGLILNYVKMEHIFHIFPNGKMKTVILKTNERNIKLQQQLGATIDGETKLEDNFGINHDAYSVSIDSASWKLHKKDVVAKIETKFPGVTIKMIDE